MRAWLMGALVVLVACGSRKPEEETPDRGEADSGGAADSGEVTDPVEPTSGHYVSDFDSISTDECGVGEELEVDGAQLWFHLDGDDLKMIPISSEGKVEDGAYDCTLDGSTFDCFVDEEHQAHGEYAATMIVSVSVDGEWTSPTDLVALLKYEISCIGSECDEAEAEFLSSSEVGQLPCTTAFSWKASWSESAPIELIEPIEGKYAAPFTGFVTDECNLENEGRYIGIPEFRDVFTPDSFLLHRFEADELFVDMHLTGRGALLDLVECNKEDLDYTCQWRMDPVSVASDALLNFEIVADGSWVSDGALEGGMTWDISCAGSDCSELASKFEVRNGFPCRTRLNYSGRVD